ncbi:MAG: HAMP domain-containing histidine kinase, partial [Rudanella sp.]|nr:HAMP domain-containing histidine kinase [Rudanella sp.]
ARNLRQRLDEGPRRDEIDQLAIHFNAMLNRLEAAFERQRSFVSHASHELRTPLAALKSEIQLGRSLPRSAEADQVMLINLETDTDRLIALINSLLFLARTMEQASQTDFGPVRLDEVVFAAQEELIRQHPAYRIDVRYDQLPSVGSHTLVEGNEGLLQRVILNLVDNACKYSPDHRADVCISAESRGCRLTVSDQGIGIPANEQVSIFEPFYRSNEAMKYEGFGIGLAICWQIIALHQGKISLNSQVGHGSQFEVWLPNR